jgi:U2 small nuclear ribonucleoprotein A'
MKLTPELLAQASSALNPNKERQLDLRGMHPFCLFLFNKFHDWFVGYKIPAIENLGVTRVRVSWL